LPLVGLPARTPRRVPTPEPSQERLGFGFGPAPYRAGGASSRLFLALRHSLSSWGGAVEGHGRTLTRTSALVNVTTGHRQTPLEVTAGVTRRPAERPDPGRAREPDLARRVRSALECPVHERRGSAGLPQYETDRRRPSRSVPSLLSSRRLNPRPVQDSATYTVLVPAQPCRRRLSRQDD